MNGSVVDRHRISTILLVIIFTFSGNSYTATKKVNEKSGIQQKRLKINPMTDVDGAWVANIETNVYQAGTFENMTIGYSAENSWDFSLSLLNTQVLGKDNQFHGYTFFTIAKTVDINKDFSITAGTQNGVALVNVKPKEWLNFSFLDNRYDLSSWLMLHAGPYLANAAITGNYMHVGFLTGSEITFIQGKLSLQLDYVSGHHSLSGATANLVYNMLPHCQVYLGVSVPEQNSGNEFAGIIGLNLSTHPL